MRLNFPFHVTVNKELKFQTESFFSALYWANECARLCDDEAVITGPDTYCIVSPKKLKEIAQCTPSIENIS
jgi:hypothetical protein